MNGNVVWQEGMVLTPHHFQRNDLYFENLIKKLVRSNGNNTFGFFSLTKDDSAIQSGYINLRSANGVFPDGKFFSLEASARSLEPKNFLEKYSPSMQSMEVFLGIPHIQDAGGNVSREKNPNSSFVAQATSVPDFHFGEAARDIQYAVDNLQILVSGEPTANYNLLKIGEISKDIYENFVWSEDQIPTLLQIQGDPALVSRLQKLADRITEKTTHIQSKGLELVPDNLPEILLYQSLQGAISWLQHYLVQATVHPEAIFVKLLELRGQLSLTQPALQGLVAPLYDHLNAGSQILRLCDEIADNLDAKSKSSYEIIPMEQSGLVFGTKLDQVKMDQLQEVILAFESPLNEDQIKQYLPRMVKVAPKSKLQAMVASAVRGMDVEWADSMPAVVRAKDGFVYFRVDRHNSLWEELINEKAIALYAPQNLSISNVELLCVYT